MGTFTISYLAKKAFDQKFTWIGAGFVYYIGRCWERAGMHKAEMMKGQSKMYADKRAFVPNHVDPWKY